MKDAAVVRGHLVSIKNVGTHKSGVLTIHVPEEEVLLAIKAFGWPTMSHPVEVAVARIDSKMQPAGAGIPPAGASEGEEFRSSSPKHGRYVHGVFAMEAGRMGNSKHFAKYVEEEMGGGDPPEAIRRYCGISSRRDLSFDEEAQQKFCTLSDKYAQWLRTKF